MRRNLAWLGLLGAVALSACDQPKERPHAAAPAAGPQAQAGPAPAPAASTGLAKLNQPAAFNLDLIDDQKEPAAHPATVSRDAPVSFAGWAYDPIANQPAKAVDVVVDGAAFGAAYGGSRQDVADHFKNPGLANTGVAIALPAGTLNAGQHTVMLRVVAADGTGYYDSAPVTFTVQ